MRQVHMRPFPPEVCRCWQVSLNLVACRVFQASENATPNPLPLHFHTLMLRICPVPRPRALLWQLPRPRPVPHPTQRRHLLPLLLRAKHLNQDLTIHQRTLETGFLFQTQRPAQCQQRRVLFQVQQQHRQPERQGQHQNPAWGTMSVPKVR